MPIVLLEKRIPITLPHNIASGINRLGVMLPYTPIHHRIFQEELQYLIMTSGNISGMPICYKDSEALKELNGIVDFFLIQHHHAHMAACMAGNGLIGDAIGVMYRE